MTKSAEWSRKFRRNNPISAMMARSKKRAEQNGWEFNLSREDIVIPSTCPVLGIPIIACDVKQSDNSASLHRIDSSKGYVKGNVICISWRANCLLRNATLEELVAITTWLSIHQTSKQVEQT